MGNMCSSEAAEILSKAIDRQLAHEGSKAMERKKLLLLGEPEALQIQEIAHYFPVIPRSLSYQQKNKNHNRG